MKCWLEEDNWEFVQTLIISDDYSSENISTYYEVKDGWYKGKHYIRNKGKLKTFVCKTTNPPLLGDDFSNAQYINLEVIVPTASLAAYQAADVWKNFWNLRGGAEDYDSTTGIEVVPTKCKKSSENVIYDISGRRLKVQQRGLNIINGKKVVVKQR